MGHVTVVVALRLVFLTAQSIERHMIDTIRRYCAYYVQQAYTAVRLVCAQRMLYAIDTLRRTALHLGVMLH